MQTGLGLGLGLRQVAVNVGANAQVLMVILEVNVFNESGTMVLELEVCGYLFSEILIEGILNSILVLEIGQCYLRFVSNSLTI